MRRPSLPAPFTAASPNLNPSNAAIEGVRRSSSATMLQRRHSLPSSSLTASSSLPTPAPNVVKGLHWLAVAERESKVALEKRSASKELDQAQRTGSKESAAKVLERRDSVSSVASTVSSPSSARGTAKPAQLGRTTSLPSVHRNAGEVSAPSRTHTLEQTTLPPCIPEGECADVETDPEIGDPRIHHVYGKLGKPKIRAALDKLCRELFSSGMTYDEFFVRIDTNGDGVLQKDEIRAELRKLGVTMLPIEMDGLLRAFDLDCNGEIEFDEFYGLLKLHQSRMPKVSNKPLPLAEDVGARVRYFVRMQGRHPDEDISERNQDGAVLGPGLTPGTVLLRLDVDEMEISVKTCFVKRLEDVEKSLVVHRQIGKFGKTGSRATL